MPRSPSAIIRKSLKNCSCSDVSIVFDFDCKELEDFLFSTMSAFCQDADVVQSARRESVGLAQRWNNNNSDCPCCRDDVENIICILDAFMNTSPMLPTKMVYQAHTFRGLLWMKSCSMSKSCIAAAQLAFTKALWIAASAVDDTVSQEEVALTMHRLGRLEGAQGNFQEAINLLEKALEKYEQHTQPQKQSNNSHHTNSMKMSQLLLNAYIEDAKTASGDFDAQRKATAAMKLSQSSTTTTSCRRSSSLSKRLSFIQEERSSREFQIKH